MVASMLKTICGRLTWIIALSCSLGSAYAAPPSFKILHTFQGSDGFNPTGGLLYRDAKGNLYGATHLGGAYGLGAVYKLAPDGTETVLHSFGAEGDAEGPTTGVIADKSGNLYGATGPFANGGLGSVYKIAPDGNESVLHTFHSDSRGYSPGPLSIDLEGNLYGATRWGGSPICVNGCGTVFRIKPSGKATTLYSFGELTAYPVGGLVLDDDGNLYGTSLGTGRRSGHAGVFELTASGALHMLHSFPLSIPAPELVGGGLIRDGLGTFYGFASSGGVRGCRGVNDGTCGFIFRIAPAGKYSIVHLFKGGNDGGLPFSLTIDKLGNLYGTTLDGSGTIFRISPSGEKTTLYVAGSEGPPQNVMVSGTRYLYGTSLQLSGKENGGTVFRLKL